MESLKQAIISSPALISIDYQSGCTVFLAVDSSFRGVGWILSQLCEDGQCRPSCFRSIGWNERESRYSQPKIELYGLFRTLRALRMHMSPPAPAPVKRTTGGMGKLWEPAPRSDYWFCQYVSPSVAHDSGPCDCMSTPSPFGPFR